MARPDTKLRFDTGWKYAPAPESTDHVRIDPQYGLFIDGEFVAPRRRQYFDDDQPGDGKTTRPGRAGRRGRCRSRGGGGAARLAAELVEAANPPSAASTSTASRARCRNGRASSR